MFTLVRQALPALRAGWRGEANSLLGAASVLAGLGSGLTPAGDDLLSGVMMWAWLAHTEARSFCASLVQVAAPRTTPLSAAFLRAAAQGECNEAWHRLLQALLRSTEEELGKAVCGVLDHGASSGADMLAGLLWAALGTTP
jgi:hypothetical protein